MAEIAMILPPLVDPAHGIPFLIRYGCCKRSARAARSGGAGSETSSLVSVLCRLAPDVHERRRRRRIAGLSGPGRFASGKSLQCA